MNFWDTLPRPLFVQAPLENVTDTVFRQILLRVGQPDVFFTEFTNTDGLLSKGAPEVQTRLLFTEKERPLVAQIWGNNPENYFKSAKLLVTMGFDGIDINMGCPERGIVKKACCAGLINHPLLAKELIQATREGIKSAGSDIPVSVKTRCGIGTWVTEEWAGFLLSLDLDVLTIHGRIAREMSQFPARWEEIGKVVALRNQMKKKTLILGNGDVNTAEDALMKIKTYGVDGVMVGRGMFHNLWIFNELNKIRTGSKKVGPLGRSDLNTKLTLLRDHIALFDATWQGKRPFEIMKKYYKIYISGFDNAQEMRMELMEFKKPEETINHLNQLIKEIK